MYLIIKYENIPKIQPFVVIKETNNREEAISIAHQLACKTYGREYVENFKDIDKNKFPYITKNFCFFESEADYSDWAVDMMGYADNLVFSVIKINK